MRRSRGFNDNILASDEIAMWKTKYLRSEQEIPKADAEGYRRAVVEYEQKMDDLAARLLGKINGAFADKCNRIMKAWKFGTISLFFFDWKKSAASSQTGQVDELKSALKTLQNDLDAERDRCATLDARVKMLEAQLAALSEEAAVDRLKMSREIEKLEEQLAHAIAARDAAIDARARDVEHEKQMAKAAADQADLRIDELTKNNTFLGSENETRRLKEEDIRFKLKDAKDDKQELQDKEHQRDIEQQRELDEKTAELTRLKTKLADKEATVETSNKMATQYKNMLERADVDKQAALGTLERKKKRVEMLEEENLNLKQKAGAYEEIYASENSKSGWFKGRD